MFQDFDSTPAGWTLSGPKFRLCDGQTRRSFLQIGGLALGGLSLPQLVRAEQTAGCK